MYSIGKISGMRMLHTTGQGGSEFLNYHCIGDSSRKMVPVLDGARVEVITVDCWLQLADTVC